MSIQQLAPEVAAKIAAGEVVERPASVVKELVENALDAGAKQIDIELLNGGLQLIRVADDGGGIPTAELPLAFARHATSKITGLQDLERVRSLGFRGEALASIGSVARVRVRSRTRAEEVGAEITMDEGQLGPVSPSAELAGTSVSVMDLFASVPARLKFLKSRAAEAGRATQVIEQYALAYPEVRFSLYSEGRQVFTTPGDGRLFGVLVAVYGLRVAEAMIPLDASHDVTMAGGSAMLKPADAEPGSIRPVVDGVVSRPSCYRSTRHFISLFVNRRWVQSRSLTYAVEEAYHSLLLAGRHPIAVINIAIDPTFLDVNVHPAKTEIKFLHERLVYSVVARSVRAAVLSTAAPPDVSPSIFSLPDRQGPSAPSAGEEGDLQRPGSHERQLPLGIQFNAAGGVALEPVAHEVAPSDASQPSQSPEKLPVLRVLGQVFQSYIITEGPDGLYLVDQHAAHERILLERMIQSWRAKSVSSQLLLQPMPVQLGVYELEAILDHLPLLRDIGFELEEFGDSTILIRALPGALAAQRTASQPLSELLTQLAGADKEAASHGETWEEHALANIACKAAIKAGQALSPAEQRELILQLEGAHARQSCCHGRPTTVRISLSALERQFDRR
jgi:DNA mismatch repair protein MutL